MRHSRLFLVVSLLAGALVRLYFLSASQWMVEGDEAAVGLQALHIMRGERPIFYPGQAYLGNLESYLVAVAFTLFGVSRYALKLVPFVFALIFIYLCYRLGTELFADERTGLFAALAAAIAPVYFVLWSLKARGGYIEALVIAQLALLWFHRWVSNPERERWALLFPLVFGFVSGYGMWMNPITIYVLAPLILVLALYLALLAIAIRDRRNGILQTSAALLGALLGLVPFFLYRVAYGNAALQVLGGNLPPQQSWPDLIGQAWQYFWRDGLTVMLGLRGPKDKPFALDWRVVVVPIYIAAAARLAPRAAMLVKPRSPLRFGEAPSAELRNTTILILMLLLAFPIFAYGAMTGGNFATIIADSGLLTRYLLPLAILMTLAVGLLLSALTPIMRLAALGLLLIVNLWSVVSGDAVALARNEYANQPLPASTADLEHFLIGQGLPFVLTNHWIGYVLTLDTREQIVTYDYTDTRYGSDRFPDYSRQVQSAPDPALVVFNPHYEPNPIDARLTQLGVSYRKAELPQFIVYFGFSPSIQPSALQDVLQWPYY